MKRSAERYEEKKKKIPMSKWLIIFLFINCTIIEIFTMYVTLKSFALAFAIGSMVDFTPLVTLIGSVVGEVIGFAIYALKSTKENTQGGIVYDLALQEKEEESDFG